MLVVMDCGWMLRGGLALMDLHLRSEALVEYPHHGFLVRLMDEWVEHWRLGA